jgi:antitoxin HigA-1
MANGSPSSTPVAAVFSATSIETTWPGHPIHPGEILGDELKERGISANQLAHQLNVPQNRISHHRGQALDYRRHRLAPRSLVQSAQFWLNLPTAYDLRLAQAAGAEIETLPVNPGTRHQEAAAAERAMKAEPE